MCSKPTLACLTLESIFTPVQINLFDMAHELPASITVTLSSLAKMIDHAMLHPTMTDSEIAAGVRIAAEYRVATACIKPYSIPQAVAAPQGTGVGVCPVIGFPHGNSTTEVKVFEAGQAAEAGGTEIDMVVNVGKVLSGDWAYVANEIKEVNAAVTARGAILKVIFENDYLRDEHIIKLCEVCSDARVAFIKTSSGFGFVKGKDGMYSYAGATLPHLRLMREHAAGHVKIKAAGRVRALEELLRLKAMGIERVGTSSTEAIMKEARQKGVGVEPIELKVPPIAANGTGSSGY